MMHQLIFLGLLFAGLICMLTAYSLYQQLTGHLKLAENRYGIMMAVGAQPHAIVLLIWRDLGLLLLIAVIPVAAVLTWATPMVLQQFQANLLNSQALVIAIISMLALCLLSTLRPCLKLVKKPIANLLQAQD
jgi:hypothetical protein